MSTKVITRQEMIECESRISEVISSLEADGLKDAIGWALWHVLDSFIVSNFTGDERHDEYRYIIESAEEAMETEYEDEDDDEEDDEVAA